MSPYASQDRADFAERVGIAPDSLVLGLEADGVLARILGGKTEKGVISGSMQMKRARGAKFCSGADAAFIAASMQKMPFLDRAFDVAISYHSLNFVPPELLPGILAEVKRVLKGGGKFAFLVRSQTPLGDAQKSDLLLAEILHTEGLMWLHDYDFLAKSLKKAAFREITMEVIKRQVKVPRRWTRVHVSFVKTCGAAAEGKIKEYVNITSEFGEELLPALQFVARKGYD